MFWRFLDAQSLKFKHSEISLENGFEENVTKSGEDCRQTISYLKGYTYLKLIIARNRVIRNLRRIQLALSEEQF